MNLSQLDFYFPYFLFFYGILMLFMMNSEGFLSLRARMRRRFSSAFPSGGPSLKTVNPFSEISLWVITIVGGLWSAQNLFL